MKIVRRTAMAVVIMVAVSLGLAGVAGAVDYTPVVCTDGQVVVNGACVDDTTTGRSDDPGSGPAVVSDDSATAAPADEAVAVSAAGTLPYTGNDSSLPLAELGVALLATGGLVVVMVRRRQAA